MFYKILVVVIVVVILIFVIVGLSKLAEIPTVNWTRMGIKWDYTGKQY
jgi:hypothetical protein